jgi:hypothetical protein
MGIDGDQGGDGGAGGEVLPATRPPVTRDTEWRARAIEAERRLAEVEKQLAAAAQEIERSRAALDAAERRRQIERELASSEAVDLETATLMTEAAVAGMDEPDVAAAVADLRRRKPFLFRGQPAVSAMSGALEAGDDGLTDLAAAARASGDRAALLRYLRMKRGR